MEIKDIENYLNEIDCVYTKTYGLHLVFNDVEELNKIVDSLNVDFYEIESNDLYIYNNTYLDDLDHYVVSHAVTFNVIFTNYEIMINCANRLKDVVDIFEIVQDKHPSIHRVNITQGEHHEVHRYN